MMLSNNGGKCKWVGDKTELRCVEEDADTRYTMDFRAKMSSGGSVCKMWVINDWHPQSHDQLGKDQHFHPRPK